MAGLTWEDAEDIGLALFEKHPSVDPITLRFTDLHRMVTELEDFDDEPTRSTEGKLESIQMAWYDEYQENT
jgi:FeS assembly protein IscX